MKALILALLCCVPSFAGYGFHRSITIDHTQVGSSDSTNFPVVLSGTYAYLATVGNGGAVTSSSGFDVVFTSDSACSSLLNFERVTYTAASGLVQFWINIPTVSHTVDTVFYECYGNGAVTTDQSNATSTWNTNFKGVYHLETVPASPDSTGSNNGAAGGSTGLAPTAVAGLIGNAASGNITAGTGGSNPRCIDIGAMSNLFNGSSTVATVSYWINLADINTVSADIPHGTVTAAGSNLNGLFGKWPTANHIFYQYQGSSGSIDLEPNASVTLVNSTWYYFSATLDLTTHANSNMYLNGVLQTQTINTSGTVPTVFATLGADQTLLRNTSNFLNGLLDEVHYANIAHSADWVTAEYNNQKSGSTFVSIGSPVVSASNAMPVVM